MLPKIASAMLNAALWYRYVEEEFVNKIHILTLRTKPVVEILQPNMNRVSIKMIVAANTCAYK
jgi:hypothetical protein